MSLQSNVCWVQGYFPVAQKLYESEIEHDSSIAAANPPLSMRGAGLHDDYTEQ